MKTIGILLIIIGFLGGAYVASLDPRTTDWAWFLPLIGAAVAGLLMHRSASRQELQSDERVAGNRRILEDSLERIVKGLQELAADKARIPTPEMRFEIDRRFRDDLDAFAEARDTLIHLFGLQSYADIMSAFAAGERYLNRVWSASTDGYVDEVLSYVDQALDQFEDARRLFLARSARAEEDAVRA